MDHAAATHIPLVPLSLNTSKDPGMSHGFAACAFVNVLHPWLAKVTLYSVQRQELMLANSVVIVEVRTYQPIAISAAEPPASY